MVNNKHEKRTRRENKIEHYITSEMQAILTFSQKTWSPRSNPDAGDHEQNKIGQEYNWNNAKNISNKDRNACNTRNTSRPPCQWRCSDIIVLQSIAINRIAPIERAPNWPVRFSAGSRDSLWSSGVDAGRGDTSIYPLYVESRRAVIELWTEPHG